MSRAVSQLSVSRQEVLEVAITGPAMRIWDGSKAGDLLASLKWNRGVGVEKLEARKADGKLILTYSHQLGGKSQVVESVNAYRFCLLWIQGCGKACHVAEIRAAAAGEISHLPRPKRLNNSRFKEIQDHLLGVAWLSLS